ncbi:hypothetical protein FQR65_LT16036 [Abscondita terminalis]|nr:hypothetical protein FQR65_LT16036 [Abscondita terminalis]
MCTSSIVVTGSNGNICVTYFKTHYGHAVDIAHIPLPLTDKENIANQLMQGIPSKTILDKIREDVDESFSRIHLTTMKDIRNISETFNVNFQVKKDINDFFSVDIWVNQMLEGPIERNCILLYKKQHFNDERFNVRKEDFMLGLMFPVQSHILKKFGNGGIICMDATHGTNPYDFHLVTVLTIDEFGHGFPTAFLFSNREDYVVLKYFLTAIKDKIGTISSLVFMSDDAEQYFSS